MENLGFIENMLKKVGAKSIMTFDIEKIKNATKLVNINEMYEMRNLIKC